MLVQRGEERLDWLLVALGVERIPPVDERLIRDKAITFTGVDLAGKQGMHFEVGYESLFKAKRVIGKIFFLTPSFLFFQN